MFSLHVNIIHFYGQTLVLKIRLHATHKYLTSYKPHIELFRVDWGQIL